MNENRHPAGGRRLHMPERMRRSNPWGRAILFAGCAAVACAWPGPVRAGVQFTAAGAVFAPRPGQLEKWSAVIARLRARGAVISRSASGLPITINLARKQVSDSDLEQLGMLRTVQFLDLSYCNKITDAGLQHLQHLTNVRQLNLRYCTQIMGTGLKHLSKLTQLENLNLYRVNVRDADLAHIKTLTRLKRLDLKYCRLVTDSGIKHLAGMQQLEYLVLYRTSLTDKGMAHLKPLTLLKHLDLSYCQITDKGLENLKGLSRLEYLRLYSTRITDRGLKYLHGLKKLRTLYLIGTPVSPVGVAQLRRALPRTSVMASSYTPSSRPVVTTVQGVSVLVKSNMTNSAKRQLLKQLKKAAGLDEPTRYSVADRADGTLFELAPLSDAAAFAKKITFGKVLKIDSKTSTIVIELKAP